MSKKTLCSFLTLATTSLLFALPPKIGTTNYKASSINNFDFNLSWEDVTIEPAKNHEIVVEIYCNKKQYAPTVKVSSNTLIIESVPITQLLGSVNKSCTVIVKVPQEKGFDRFTIHTSSGDINSSINFDADSIYIEASSGDINVEEQLSSNREAVFKTSSGSSYVNYINTNKLTAQASSGNILIDKAVSKNAVINTSSGDISLNGGKAESLTMSASSGDISCSNFSGGDTSIETTSGNIKLSQFKATSFHSSASSGNITAKDLDCEDFNVSTTSGTIGLELLDPPSGKSSVSSSSGTQFLSMPKGSRFTLIAKTSSGSFTNTFTKDRISSHVDYNNAINGGGAKLTMTSSSGGITVDVGSGVASRTSRLSDSDDADIPVVIFGDEK